MDDSGARALGEDPLVVPDADGRPLRFSTGNAWRPLVDNEVAFHAMIEAASRAKRRILLSQLMFEPDLQMVFTGTLGAKPDAGEAPDATSAAGARIGTGSGSLADELRCAARRGVHIRVLLNENTLVPDHVDEMRQYLDDEHQVAVRAARRNPAVMHAKMMVVDDEAFLIGSPFQQLYWDTRLHCALELRRNGKRPLHDVSVHLRGPVVADIVDQFARLWQTSAGDDDPHEADVLAPPRTDAESLPFSTDDAGPELCSGLALQVVLTSPRLGEEILPPTWKGDPSPSGSTRGSGGADPSGREERAREHGALRGTARTKPPPLVPASLVHAQQRAEPSLVTLGARLIDKIAGGRLLTADENPVPHQPGELTVLDAYARAFDHAERFVYAENQYFTSAILANLLDRALTRNPRLEVILVLNEHMDIPSYDGTQLRILQQLLEAHPERLGVFSLWTTRLARRPDGTSGLRHVYVHSKTTVVDDAWATIGSANWDGASMEGAQELGIPGVRNEELNVVLHAAHCERDEAAASESVSENAAARLRIDLWSEILGLVPESLREPPPEGWLALWRRVADANLNGLHKGSKEMQGHVLPYAPDLPRAGLHIWS